jgi:4-amino-4-deoxy-L-arabinose transferase-like glycosyltransferase
LLLPGRLVYLIPLIALTLAALVVAIVRRSNTSRASALMMIAWIVGTYVTVALPGTFFPHYYQLWIPPLCVGGGCGAVALARALGRPRLQSLIGSAATIVIALFVLPQYADDAKEWSIEKYGVWFVEVREVGQLAEKLVPQGQTFFEIGTDPGLYYYAHRRPSSGILWAHRALIGPYRHTWAQKAINDLNASRPDLVIMDRIVLPPKKHPYTTWLRENNFVPFDNPEIDAMYSRDHARPEDRRFVFMIRKGSAMWDRAQQMSMKPSTRPLELPSAPAK